MNKLYYGDNLEILRNEIKDESIDLIYLDPPFNSQATYNVLFKAPSGEHSPAQVEAFEDTWHWSDATERAFDEVIQSGNTEAAEMLRALRGFLNENDMMAYIAMMAVRLLELHRVMKPSATLYLHCDPTASHYLKIVLDSIFGPINFRNEIIWRRSHPKGHAFTRFARNHDVILAIAKDAGEVKWNPQYTPHSPEAAAKQYKLKDKSGRLYQLTSLLNPNPDRPNLTYKFLGVTKVWRWTKERMMDEYKKGRIVVPKSGKGIPRYKRYLDEQEGVPVSDLWTDIEFAGHGERLGYPTQKPRALLERIINASSAKGDVVLDPFCGCGTAIHAAQKLKRKWIGIDITHLAIAKIENRLADAFPSIVYEVHGTPKDLDGAHDLAKRDKYEFQWWAASLVKFDPVGGKKKKGADKGIDGIRYFKDFDKKTHHPVTEKIILSVKGGEDVGVGMIRDLAHVIDREKAKMGLFVTLAEPTGPMVTEALSEGYFEASNGKYRKLQIITVEDLLGGKKPDLPPIDSSASTKAAEEAAEQAPLFAAATEN